METKQTIAACKSAQPPQVTEALEEAPQTPLISPANASELNPLEENYAKAPVRPTIFIMHASVGSGHRSAANAIAQAFEILRETNDPDLLSDVEISADTTIEVIDILDFGRIVFDGDKTASMFTGFGRPIYDLTWRYTFTGRLLWAGGTGFSRVMYPKFTEYVREKQPLAIVCTHIMGANVAVGARMITGQRYPVICVPTDYETEGLWPHRESDLFCVATESMAETLRPRKVPDQDIRITGIPTRDDFRRTYDKDKTRETLGLPEDKMVVLALAGAYLPRPYIHFREALDKLLPYLHTYPTMHFVFIAGNDKQYAEHMRQQCADLGLTNTTIFEYVEDMAALMAASDLAICKSGGLTVTECLCAQVPMILLGRAYGQENANVRMLTSMGAAMHVTTARELLDAIRHIAKDPRSTQAMLINGSILRHPQAALDVARETLRLARAGTHGELPPHRKHFVWFYWGKKPAHIR